MSMQMLCMSGEIILSSKKIMPLEHAYTNQQNKFIWGVFKGIIHRPFPFIYNPRSVIIPKLHFLKDRVT